MAIVKGIIQVTGSVRGVSFYTRRGSDQIIMRTKGGISGEKLKKLPQFEGVRNQQKEMGGCAKFASGARLAMGGLHRLADYNISPVLTGIASKIQKQNTETEKGKRTVNFSDFKQSLEGFNLNRNFPFNSVLRVSTACELNRDKIETTVTFGRINTETDLVNIQKLPWFRLLVVIGAVSDMAYSEELSKYIPVSPGLHGAASVTISEWFPTHTIINAQTLTAAMTEKQTQLLTDTTTLLVSIGVEFGTIGFDGKPTEVKYAGSAKVLKVG